jgi:hypothetical protein
MADLHGFDANTVDPSTPLDPVPSGKYVAAIVASAMKPTKDKSGSFLELTFQILDGEYRNRKLWTRLNLDNANATAVQIARGQLSAICRAVGVTTPKDSTELHDLPLEITVKLKPRKDTGDLSNEIAGFAKKGAAAAAAPARAASGTPPWARK